MPDRLSHVSHVRDNPKGVILMRTLKLCAVLVAGLAFLASPAPVAGTDGHFLHGVGAVNSAMGGAGVAGPRDLLGAFYHNPAGLMAFDGTRVDLAFELFKPSRTVSSTVGSLSGATESKSDFVPIPAFGWSRKLDNGKVVVGVGGMGIGGFGVDYPADPTNPVLGPRPFGFGQVFSDYSLLKITPTVAFAPSERFWIGVSGHINWARLTVDPAPFAAPDADPGPDMTPFTQDDRAFYPRASAADGAYGVGFQLGFIWAPNDVFAVGGSFTSPQTFSNFEYNAMHENPNLPNYGTPYPIEFSLDIPAVIAGGVKMSPLPNMTLMADGHYYFYESAAGFELENPEAPFNADGSVAGFGWQNIFSLSFGGELIAGETVALRAGYNYAQDPVAKELSFINIPAPAIVQHHATLGIGFQINRQIGVNAAYYHAFENMGAGPVFSPLGPIPGSEVTNALSEDSLIIQFSFVNRGRVFD